MKYEDLMSENIDDYEDFNFNELKKGEDEIEITKTNSGNIPLTIIRNEGNSITADVITTLEFDDDRFNTFSPQKFKETIPKALAALNKEGKIKTVSGDGSVEKDNLTIFWKHEFPLEVKQTEIKDTVLKSPNMVLNKTDELLTALKPGSFFKGSKKLS